MSLRYALLGYLSTSPASGYTLGRDFADGAGAMWEALPSQIYPELAKLETLGWINGTQDSGDRLKRRLYALTAAGEHALQAWVESADAVHPAERDAERVRFLFLDRSEPAVVRRHIERYRAHYEDCLARWLTDRDAIDAGTHPRMIDRLAGCNIKDRAVVTKMKWLAFDGLVRRAQAELDWADAILSWLHDSHAGIQGRSVRVKRTSVVPLTKKKLKRTT